MERRDLAWAYLMAGHILSGKNPLSKSQLLSALRQAARHESTVDLLPVLLEHPKAQEVVGKNELLMAGLQLHRARVRRSGQRLSGQRVSKEASPFEGGLLAALIASRFEADPRRRRQLLAEAVLAAPDNIQAWVRLSMAEDELKNIPESIGALRNALRVDGDEPETLNNLAYMLATNRPQDLEEAERFARRSLLLRPRPATLDTLAEIRFRRGDRVGALAWIKLAQALDPTSKFYARQAQRIEAGDPKAPVPSEDE
jgi:Flp pilus assembly protein TadD